ILSKYFFYSIYNLLYFFCFFFQAEDGIRDSSVTGVQTCALPISKAVVRELAATGYQPPTPIDLPVFGEPLAAEIKLGIYLMRQAGRITDYEVHIARKLAHVICGGDVTRPSSAPEQYFLDLEREAFKSLCGEPNTLARMEHL